MLYRLPLQWPLITMRTKFDKGSELANCDFSDGNKSFWRPLNLHLRLSDILESALATCVWSGGWLFVKPRGDNTAQEIIRQGSLAAQLAGCSWHNTVRANAGWRTSHSSHENKHINSNVWPYVHVTSNDHILEDQKTLKILQRQKKIRDCTSPIYRLVGSIHFDVDWNFTKNKNIILF